MNDTLKECPLAELIAMLETTVVEDGCSIFDHSAEELGLALMDCHAEVLTALRAELPDDVRRLVIAARVVAFEDQGAEALRELDQASEAFADRVPWDDEPEAIAAWNARKSPRTDMGDEMSDFLAGHVTYTDEGEDSYWSAEIQQFGGDYLVATVYAHDEETVRWRQEAILNALRTGEATDV